MGGTSGRGDVKSFLSVKQCVAKLNGAVSVKTVYKLAALGKLRVNRATGKMLIEEDSLEELMAVPAPVSVPVGPPHRSGRGSGRKSGRLCRFGGKQSINGPR